MRGFRWVAAALLAALLCALCAVPAAAEGPPEISAGGAIVVELNTGRVLYEYHADWHYYPASTTKILTGLIACEQLTEDDVLEFTGPVIYAVAEEARHFELQPGEAMPLRSCLQALLLPSCNEAACAIAFRLGGSEEGFAELMNRRARQAGAENSHFVTPNGLHTSSHYVTARDMAKIYTACVGNELFRSVSSQWRCSITDARLRTYDYETHNGLMRPDSPYHRDWIVCSKTGRTGFAGNALMSYAEKDGMRLVCALLSEPSYAASFDDTVRLFEYCLGEYKVFSCATAAENVLRSALGACETRIEQTDFLLAGEMPPGPVLCRLGDLRRRCGTEFEGTLQYTLPDGTLMESSFEALALPCP